jgi:RNA-directed DNA polymerase
MSLDVRRYFPSVSHAILGQLYDRRLRDPATRALVARLIASGGEVYRSPLAIRVLGLADDPLPPGCCLPLGGFFSHWSGALYLDGLDHFVARTLKVRGYLRYMDDLTLFGDTVGELEDAREAVREWLARERRLQLKQRRAAVQPTAQPATYLGFRISRAGLSMGPKAKRRLRRALAGVDAPADGLVRTLQSYRGLFLTL